MACISCGVITRAWLWRSWRRWVTAIRALELVQFLLGSIPAWGGRSDPFWRFCLKLESLPQVEPADVRVIYDVVGAALHQHLAGINDVGPVGQAQGFTHIVVGDQHPNAPVGQMPHQGLDVAHCDGI